MIPESEVKQEQIHVIKYLLVNELISLEQAMAAFGKYLRLTEQEIDQVFQEACEEHKAKVLAAIYIDEFVYGYMNAAKETREKLKAKGLTDMLSPEDDRELEKEARKEAVRYAYEKGHISEEEKEARLALLKN